MDTPETTSESTGSTEELPSSFNERFHMLKTAALEERKGADAEPEAAVEAEASEAPEAGEAPAPALTDDEEAKLAEVRAARRAQLEQLMAAERAADAKRRARQRPEPPKEAPQTQDLAKLQARLQELEALEQAFADPATLLAIARQKGADPMKFGEALRESVSNPEFFIEQKVKSALSEYEKKIQEIEQKYNEKFEALQRQQRQAAAVAAEQEAAQELISFTKESARVAPLSHAFLDRHGEQQYVTLALNVAQALPPGCGLDKVHEAIEQTLEAMQLASPSPAPSIGKNKPTRPPADKGKTVSNALASQRVTVVEDDEDWADLPYNERLERLKRRVKSL